MSARTTERLGLKEVIAMGVGGMIGGEIFPALHSCETQRALSP